MRWPTGSKRSPYPPHFVVQREPKKSATLTRASFHKRGLLFSPISASNVKESGRKSDRGRRLRFCVTVVGGSDLHHSHQAAVGVVEDVAVEHPASRAGRRTARRSARSARRARSRCPSRPAAGRARRSHRAPGRRIRADGTDATTWSCSSRSRPASPPAVA